SGTEQNQIGIINAIRATGVSNPVSVQPLSGWDMSNIPTVTQAVGTSQLFVTPHMYDSSTNPNDPAQYVASDISQARTDGLFPVFDEFGNATDGWNLDPYGNNTIQAVISANQSGQAGALFWAAGNGYHPDGADSAFLNPTGSQLTSTGQTLQPWLSGAPPALSAASAPSQSAASPDNTVITASGGGAITDANGNTWSITNGQVAVNGTPDGQSANVIELAYEKGQVWQENSSNLWWSKSSPSDTWSPGPGTSTSPVPATTAPTPPPPPGPSASPDNTVITAASGGSITDASGNAWSIANGQVAVNGTPDGQSANVIELAYEKGLVWQENSNNLWWSKSSPSDTWSPGPGTSTSPVPTATVSADTLTLTLSEDAYNGDAQFIAKMDGTQLGAAQSVTASNGAGQTQDFTFSGTWGAGPHNVEVDFINDAYAGPGQDRNLYVDQVTYDGKTAMSQPTTLWSNGGVTIAVQSAVQS
ncbi:MAG: cellulase family glycosylhydrolase, partial [Acetobacteraceae bacterium]|nr:cellulase family glycosylhydrolase [Acetobacteraceae bacterium]